MITYELIAKIISAGNSSQAKLGIVTQEIDDLAPYREINTTGPDTWKLITSDIQTDDLFALIRGLTLTEREHRWSGGSAASVIWIFREIEHRSSAFADVVADWVLANTGNKYLPYGFNNDGARSLAEYRALSQSRAELDRVRQIEQEEKMTRVEYDRKILSQQRSRAILLRRSPDRKLLIQELGELSPKEQLELISADPLYPPNFYSTRCASNSSIEVLASLSKEVRQAHLTKLKGKQKGPWAKLKKRLRTLEPLPWE